MTKFQVIDKNLQKMAILAKKKPYFWPPGAQKGVKMIFWEKAKTSLPYIS